MSFREYKKRIDYGDTVIVYMGYESMLQFEVERGKVHQTKFGAIRHDALIGIKFGSRVKCARGYVHVLYPTPELWTVNLPHRTQILYATDISIITFQLELKPGSVVVESGTGSASLSHSILRTIAPIGHLYTFDFHAVRVEKAREEFQRHGLADMVTVAHRDVCKEGFNLEKIADAVFLDLPSPWEALPFAKKTLLPGGRVCSFSPCIEQVQRTCKTMRDLGFTDVHTMECLLRPLDARTMVVPMPDLGYGPGKSYMSSVSHPSEESEKSSGVQTGSIVVDTPIVGHIEIESRNKTDIYDQSRKKLKLDEAPSKDEHKADSEDEKSEEEEENEGDDKSKNGPADKNLDSKGVKLQNQPKSKASYVFKSGMPAFQMPGHTGYLTFATVYP